MRLHDYNISQKVGVIIEHFKSTVMGLLQGQAKAMVVTGSRKEAVRYKLGFDTNQMCMSVGSPASIFLEDPQCMRVVDTRIQDNALHFILYFRSWDLWGGFPTNLGGLQLLKEYMAKEIGVDDGCLIAFSKGLHLYEHCWDLAKMVLRMELD